MTHYTLKKKKFVRLLRLIVIEFDLCAQSDVCFLSGFILLIFTFLGFGFVVIVVPVFQIAIVTLD